jgi:hypothetical protein
MTGEGSMPCQVKRIGIVATAASGGMRSTMLLTTL